MGASLVRPDGFLAFAQKFILLHALSEGWSIFNVQDNVEKFFDFRIPVHAMVVRTR